MSADEDRYEAIRARAARVARLRDAIAELHRSQQELTAEHIRLLRELERALRDAEVDKW